MQFDGFDWDHGNRDKCQKHGVSAAEIENLFERTVHVGPDLRHSDQEERFKAIGADSKGRKVLVVFTLRRKPSETLLRPISARYMHRKEVAYYAEKEAPGAEE